MRRLVFPIEFTGERGDRLYVVGRVWGDLIRLGDCFTSAVPDVERPEVGVRSMSLVVCGILTYGKSINQIDHGMTTELELQPQNDARPAIGEVLIGDAALPPFADCEILGTGEFHIESM
jgi:hypothetical protein